MRWEVATDRGSATSYAAARFATGAEPRPHGQGRRHRAEAGDLVLLPLPPARRHQPGRPHPHRARRRRDARRTCASASSRAPTCRPAGSAAYRGLAARDDLHAVLHLGDYLYEYGPGEYGYGPDDERHPHRTCPPTRWSRWPTTGSGTRSTSSDPDLQDLHAKYPWIITWDDHEVANDQWTDGAENHTPTSARATTATRRARAHRAYDEWMPVRMDGTARLGDGDRLFRRLRFGRLAELSMLDLRTYRSQQVADRCPTPVPGAEAEVSDPDRTITGAPADGLAQGVAAPQPRRSGR